MSKESVACLILAVGLLTTPTVCAADEALWNALQRPGHVLLMRHALAPGSGDPAHFALKDCATQRNLSVAGRAQAQRIGETLRDRRVPNLVVFSSQWCRCLETAQMLGISEVTALRAANSFFKSPEKGPLQNAALIKWIRRQPLDLNILIVTHQVNITALTDHYPGSGDITVLKRDKKRGFKMLGALTAADFAPDQPRLTLTDAKASLERRIVEARRAGQPSDQAQHLFALAQLERERGELPSAHRHLVDAYALQRATTEHVARAHTALSLSLVLKELGRLRSAEDAARDALVLDSDVAVFEGALNQLGQITAAYQTRGDIGDARRLLVEIQQLQRDALADLHKIDDYQQLARQYFDSGAYTKMEKLLDDALEIAVRHDAWHQSAVAHELLGNAYKEQDKAGQAVEYYRAGITFAKRCGRCALLERLERHITDVSNSATITLKDNPDDQIIPRSKALRFAPLPR